MASYGSPGTLPEAAQGGAVDWKMIAAVIAGAIAILAFLVAMNFRMSKRRRQAGRTMTAASDSQVEEWLEGSG
jgi:hypothetical protein